MARSQGSLTRLAGILAFGTTTLLAQGTQTAGITGTITQKGGAPLAGATVILTSPSMQGVRQTRSGDDGRFIARLLPPGEYKIVVAMTGYQSVTIHQRVGLEQTFSPHIVLNPVGGAVVEVVATSVSADKTEIKSATNFTKEEVDALPVSRADMLQIAYLTPGVVPNMNEARGGVQIRGSMGTGNLVMVDGQNVMDNLYQGQRIGIVFDAVEETQVLTGAISAEYGNIEGGVIQSITKSGGDEFTGALRFDLQSPRWNAVKPFTDRSAIDNSTGTEKSITVGGPIIKSKLWFFAAGYEYKPVSVQSFDALPLAYGSTDGVNPNPTYSQKITDIRREVKLTWAITDNNTLVATYNNNKKITDPQDYGAGERVALTYLPISGEFWSVAYRSILASNLTFNAKYGEKKQTLPGGGLGGRNGAIATATTDDNAGNFGWSYFYRNGWYDPQDPSPDSRDNRTFNAKLSYFWTGKGSHETDFGLDYYQGVTTASGFQSPNYATLPGVGYVNIVEQVDHIDVPTGTAINDANGPDANAGLWAFKWIPDKATLDTYGIFVNDKWTVDKSLTVHLGLRVDSYTMKGEVAGKIASNTSYSPRLGLKYDFKGDGAWVGGLSFNRMTGRILETTMQGRTYVNDAIEYFLPWIGPANWVPGSTHPYAYYDDLTQYATTPTRVTNGPVTVQFDPKLKPQCVDEWSGSFTHNYRTADWGNGFLRATVTNKHWSNIIDYTQGNNGFSTDPTTGVVVPNTYWRNDPEATRDYRSLELDGAWQKGGFNVGGNIVWSRLYGNFVGEAKASPGSGQGLDYFTVQEGVQMYDYNITNPKGYLPGHVPLRMRLLGTYIRDSFLGRQTLGLVYRFDSGAHYDNKRTVDDASLLNPPVPFADQFGNSFTQYMDMKRGAGVYSAQAYLDFSFQQDFTLKRLPGGRVVAAYAKVDITNLFNHMQITNWAVAYNDIGTGDTLATPWTVAPGSFAANDPSNFGEARAVRLSFGVKF